MQYSAGYVPFLLNAQHNIARDLGVDIMGAGLETYRINLTQLAITSMVMKKVQDIVPAVTDAVWQQALNVAIDTGPAGDRSGWPGWVVLQVRPEDLAQYGATTADSVTALQAKIDAYNQAQNAAVAPQQTKAAR